MPTIGKDMEQLGLSYAAVGWINWYKHFGKILWQHLLKLNIYIPYEAITPLLVYM